MGKTSSKLKPKVPKDLVGQTEFTHKELKEWYKGFQKNAPNGFLNVTQFKTIYCNFFPQGHAEEFAGHVFRTFDKNGDGSIDFREFIIGLSVTNRGTVDQKLRWAFNMYDLDGSGDVSREEILVIIQAIYKMVGKHLLEEIEENSLEERVDNIFKTMDKNLDGGLSIDEFIEGTMDDATLVTLLQCGPEEGFEP